MGMRRLAVVNGPNNFQMLLVGCVVSERSEVRFAVDLLLYNLLPQLVVQQIYSTCTRNKALYDCKLVVVHLTESFSFELHLIEDPHRDKQTRSELRPHPTLTLTFDLDLQSHESYNRDPYTCKRSRSVQKLEHGNRRTYRRT